MNRRQFSVGLGLLAGVAVLAGCAPKTQLENKKEEDVLTGPPAREKGKGPNTKGQSPE